MQLRSERDSQPFERRPQGRITDELKIEGILNRQAPTSTVHVDAQAQKELLGCSSYINNSRKEKQ